MIVIQQGRVLRACDMRLSAIGEFDFGTRTAIWATDQKHEAAPSMCHSRGRRLIDHRTVAEALEPERRINRVWLVFGYSPRKEMP